MKKEIVKQYKAFRKSDYKPQIWWEFLAELEVQDEINGTQYRALVKEVVSEQSAVEQRLQKYIDSPLFRNKIRKYVNFYAYSDVHPFEVIEILTPKTVRIREMKATLKTAPIMHVGGFTAHTENYTQEWTIEPDEKGNTQTIRLSSKGWGKGKFRMADKPVYFYDYNF